MRRNDRYSNYNDAYDVSANPEKYILPYIDIENFISDSTDMDLGLTFIDITSTDKCHFIKCFNNKGIQSTYKKPIPKKLTVVNLNDIPESNN